MHLILTHAFYRNKYLYKNFPYKIGPFKDLGNFSCVVLKPHVTNYKTTLTV